MKVRLIVQHEIAGEMLEAGQSVIVSDEEGAALVAAGMAEPLAEAALGGFAVPMTRD